MTALADIILREIQANGPMDLGRYMTLCLGHPAHGYYMTRDPFGAQGDFTTAPEISQLFGEMIGAWAVDAWLKMGAPNPVTLVECGPGRGTLMQDALRATRAVPEFHAALGLHLVEMSPVLRSTQARALQAYAPVWHDTVATIPDDAPVILIGNEFLDALPVRQLMWTQSGWMERVVGQDGHGGLALGLAPAPPHLVASLPPAIPEKALNACIEISPVLNLFLEDACKLLLKHAGVALFIDYGYPQTACGETLQAVKSHQFVSLLCSPGEADLTAHVNFETVGTLSRRAGLSVAGPVTQGAFLNRLGIAQRVAVLSKNATDRQKNDMNKAIDRLCADGAMGDLFKVMAIFSDPALNPAGFE